MFKFIVISSNQDSLKKYQDTITKVFINSNFHYECDTFNDNNKNLFSILESNECKENIYIIEDSNIIDSIGLLTKIREEILDIRSFIIIINFNKKINICDCETNFQTHLINDEEKYLSILEKYINNIIELKNNTKDQLIFNHNRISYSVSYDEINYIEKVISTKLCKINTVKGVFRVKKTVTDFKNVLPDNFFQTHRSGLINLNNINNIDFKTNIITFKNGKKIDLISRNNKKLLKEKLTIDRPKITN